MKEIVFLSGFIGSLLTVLIVLPAVAQVTSDNTTNTTVNLNGNNFNIINGIKKGNNLFHSFKEFSIPKGSSAIFNNSTDVVNIINRVTGGNISNLDGLIKANGNANLFLINPAGIVFGENASLDIGGSFFGSTAQSILFKDGFEFSAVNPQEKPLLTVSVPVGLQVGTNPGKIEVNGSGHNLITADVNFAPYINPGSQNPLQVKPGKTLALIGSDIALDGAILNAETGRVELSSVRDGVVKLNQIDRDFNLDISRNSTLGNIQLSQKSLIDVSGAGAGSIQVNGSSIKLQDGSLLYVQNRGLQSAGDINVNATESLQINGMSVDGNIRTGILNETLAGNSGNINITTKRLIISDGGAIGNRTLSSASSGNVSLNATELIEVSGVSAIKPTASSSIASITVGDGKAGDISVFTPKFSVVDSAVVATTSFRGGGNGGNITINSLFFLIADDAGISVSNFGTGDAGMLKIDADKVKLDNLGRLAAITTVGEGGNISLQSQNLQMRGESFISTSAGGTGNGGNININTDTIVALENSDITANAQNSFGGKVIINAQGIFGTQFRDNLTAQSDITASSQLGAEFSGVVELNTPGIDPNSGITELPANILDSSKQIASGCSNNTGNSFVVTGRGGMPENPSQSLHLNRIWSDIRDLSVSPKGNNNSEVTTISSKPAIVEATHFIRNQKGEIELVAAKNTHEETQQISECRGNT